MTGLFALRTESQAPTRSPLDVPGGLLLAGVMVALVLGIGAAGTSAPTIAVIAAAAIAIVLGIVLRAFERRAPKPLLSATLLRRAAFAGGLAVSACLQLALIGLVVYGAAWLQGGLDLSPSPPAPQSSRRRSRSWLSHRSGARWPTGPARACPWLPARRC